jgi:CheY-like chemotaxis protein
MNGIGVAEEIRKMENYKNIPMIALTGYAMYGDREKLLSFGFTEYIAKPFTKYTITEALKKLLKM